MPPKKEHERRSSIATSQIDDSNKTATTPKQSKEPISLLSEDTESEIEPCGIGPNSSLQPSESASVGTEHQETGIIARLCRVTLESLAFLVRSSVLTTTARNKNILRRCHATLKLWMNGHHIWTGELDRALEGSENLKHTTLSVLHSLCVPLLLGLKTHLDTSPDDTVAVQLLKKTTWLCSYAKPLLSDFNQPTSDIDSSDDDVSDDGHDTNGTDRMVEKIKMYTHCLLDLSAALECPALDASLIRSNSPRFKKVDYSSDATEAPADDTTSQAHDSLYSGLEGYMTAQEDDRASIDVPDLTFGPSIRSQAQDGDMGEQLSLPDCSVVAHSLEEDDTLWSWSPRLGEQLPDAQKEVQSQDNSSLEGTRRRRSRPSPIFLEGTAPTVSYITDGVGCGIQGCHALLRVGSDKRELAKHKRQFHPELIGHAPSPTSSSTDGEQSDDPGKAPPSPCASANGPLMR